VAGILTTHVGALPDPAPLTEGARTDDDLRAAVRQVVRLQRDVGIDVVNEGELTKGGNFVTYINERLSGFEAGDASLWPACSHRAATGQSSPASTRSGQ
jgi:5-methyltetrahydropteroyltriglutamate--homocysteine methyltransferase